MYNQIVFMGDDEISLEYVKNTWGVTTHNHMTFTQSNPSFQPYIQQQRMLLG